MNIQYPKIQHINLHKIAAQRNVKLLFDGRSFFKKLKVLLLNKDTAFQKKGSYFKNNCLLNWLFW
ncbi:hypothetical protein AAW12_12375 [Sphingobacterium sp. Ag1]|nr:hypothetical protein AAW12_12375 [Sphingobacterium sp. Ag1]